VLGPGESIGIRIPDHPVMLAILRAFGSPLVVTSANRSGEPPAISVEEALASLQDCGSGEPGLAGAVDAGRSPVGEPSTVVDARSGRAEILREGAIPTAAIRSVEEAVRRGSGDETALVEGERGVSPGNHSRSGGSR
jgi:L-threonylcarbamoyladenylate synthase